ncbi:MAG: sulfotransferase [Phycisphaerales bacterium]
MADFQRAIDQRQAVQLFNARNYAEAEQICKQILRRHKDDVTALQVMAGVTTARIDFARAAEYHQKCITLKPKDPEHRFRLAILRTFQGQYDEAVTEFGRVLKLRHDHRAALSGMAEALERQGKYDEARGILLPVIEQRNEDAQAALVYMTLQQHAGHHRQAIATAKLHVDRDETDARTRWRLWLSIGKSYEATGEYDEAFGAYQEGNSSVSSSFDGDAYIKAIDSVIDAFSLQAMSTLPRSRFASQRPIFIIGMPRSGTTLVEKILDAHSQVHGGGELGGISRLVASMPSMIDSLSPYPQSIVDMTIQDVDRLAKAYLDDLSKIKRGTDRVVDKSLGNFKHLGLISILFPEASVIHCLRDPLDTCFSCFASQLSPAEHGYALDLEHLGIVYRQYERLMQHWNRLPDLQMMRVRYEDLLTDQEAVTRMIVQHCKLKWDDACLRFYDSKRTATTLSYDQVRRPIYKSSMGRAQRFESFLKPLKLALDRRRDS